MIPFNPVLYKEMLDRARGEGRYAQEETPEEKEARMRSAELYRQSPYYKNKIRNAGISWQAFLIGALIVAFVFCWAIVIAIFW